MAYKGSVTLAAGLTQKNGLTFPLVDATAVNVSQDGEDSSLSTVLTSIMAQISKKYEKPETGIPSQDIADFAIETHNIAPQAVDTDRIADGCVTENKIADSCITMEKMEFTDWICTPSTWTGTSGTYRFTVGGFLSEDPNPIGWFLNVSSTTFYNITCDAGKGDLSSTELTFNPIKEMVPADEDFPQVKATRRRIIPTKTSDLVNDGNDGSSPFATLADIPEIPDPLWEAGENEGAILQLHPEGMEFKAPGGDIVQVPKNKDLSPFVTVEGAGNIAGLKGYRYIDTGTPTDHLTFEHGVEGWDEGDVVSVINKSKYSNCATIVSIGDADNDNHVTVIFDKVLPIGSSFVTEDHYDSKVVYVISKPDVGDIPIGYGAYTEGFFTQALNTVSHAEGYGTKALGEYSHAEGRETEAQYAGHAEGYKTKAGYYSHAEGISSIASGEEGSHAEGRETKALGKSSHAEGISSTANGKYSHAENETTNALGQSSHAEGLGKKEAITPNVSAEAGSTTYTVDSTNGLTVGTIVYYNGVFASITQVEDGDNSTTITTNASLNPNDALSNAKIYKVVGYVSGDYAHGEGKYTKALKEASHAEGNSTTADGAASHAEGHTTIASGAYSHSEGYLTTASGPQSHAEGHTTEATSHRAHAEGANTHATNEDSHAEGNTTTASGKRAHAEGYSSKARSDNSHAEGYSTYADGTAAHAEGNQAKAAGSNSHAEGSITSAIGNNSHSEGEGQRSNSEFTFSGAANAVTYTTSANHGLAVNDVVCYGNIFARVIEVPQDNTFKVNTTLSTEEISGKKLTLVKGCAFGDRSHVEGYYTKAIGSNSHTEGSTTLASGPNAHAEGTNTIASGTDSHAEGNGSKATSFRAHAEGVSTTASGQDSHAEGSNTTASGNQSHAEGFVAKATAPRAHAEGANTTASHEDTHAEGNATTASGKRAHSEGISTTASGNNSHAEGNSSKSIGDNSHAEGLSTIANNEAEHSEGKYNVSNTGTIHSIGIGTGASNRRNAVEVMSDGKMYLKDVGGYDGTSVTGKQDLATVINGMSGGGSVSQVNADWNATSGVAEILHKPTIPTNTNQLTNGAGFITAADIPAPSNHFDSIFLKCGNDYYEVSLVNDNGTIKFAIEQTPENTNN